MIDFSQAFFILLFLLLPIALIVGIYRLMARITYRKSKQQDLLMSERERRENRVFSDEEEKL